MGRQLPVTALMLAILLLGYGSRVLAEGDELVIVGGTLIDVSRGGREAHDIKDAIVVIRDGRIIAVSAAKNTHVPPRARLVRASGQFIVPGLIDGFGALRSQGFADAYLYEGVTTVAVISGPAGSDGEQSLFKTDSGPGIRRMATIGAYNPDASVPKPYPWITAQPALSNEALLAEMQTYEHDDVRGFFVGWDVGRQQLDAIVQEVHRRGLAISGEFARTAYPDAARTGASVFVRSDHYLTALASPQILDAYRDDPTGKAAGPAYRAVCGIDISGEAVKDFAQVLIETNTALMPILTIEATADDLGTPNPWHSRSSSFVRVTDLDDPVDPVTNARPYLEQHPDRRAALQDCARSRQQVDGALHRLGVMDLLGSGAPAFGIMPGGGVHQELTQLERIGLTPREALAAATSNISDRYRWTDVGAVEPGRAGDILIVGSDPRIDVEALSDIRTVIHAGRVVDRAKLWANATQEKRARQQISK
jgi:hypothetical protein